MNSFQDNFSWSFKAKHPLKVIVVGAGIAGLTVALGLKKAGHEVLILERVHEIAEVGAGIQVAPNAARILGRLGLLDRVMDKANVLEKNSLRRYANNEELGTAPLMPQVGQKYHAPLAVIHRGDLQRILLDGVRDANIELRTSSRVVRAVDDFEATVQLESGEWISGDVVIAADGIKSDLRHQIASHHGVKDICQPTGDAAYRIMIPKDKLQGDKRALELLNHNVGMRWMGPGGHIMAYPIKNNTVYNMVLLHPQKPGASNEESWTSKGDKQEMISFYSKWNDLVRSLLSYVPDGEVMEWTLNSHFPLPSWVENKCVLMGDACHPMLPYVAQGAAQAIEDAGVLTCALSMTDSVPKALAVYELVRKDRAERIQKSAAVTRKALHLPDGEEQVKRDEAIRGSGKNPDLWADPSWQDFMWGTDVMKDTVENWDDLVAKSHGYHVHAVHALGY
ncbi:FAD/NAD(P)-binding domain-containing protein [Aspergillus aculeatinus CBS 121060]|uniref:FAD/NAD(P)-binding domain-containing protein n=1 Tax=Aspergillus aculeatinus CBS 121060 TaxID=1448322 RepID=A0ACD1GU12_9EURO|nr:FAD/NAD(P)-binding domain-containing protein [Aspergillus aculeatinus CBS 121060]RAH64856.1 FAD/NAD(P)-binding domain-containing protein [Aspergillus aculeatinus CBS 121060]